MDGFRFDLASALCRDPLGAPIPAPPLIRQIAKDPVLSKARLAPTRCPRLAGPSAREIMFLLGLPSIQGQSLELHCKAAATIA